MTQYIALLMPAVNTALDGGKLDRDSIIELADFWRSDDMPLLSELYRKGSIADVNELRAEISARAEVIEAYDWNSWTKMITDMYLSLIALDSYAWAVGDRAEKRGQPMSRGPVKDWKRSRSLALVA